jgi:lon-related putative ATP-dependent protease
MEHRELTADELVLDISEEEISRLSAETELPEIIGQPRALRALKMGTEIRRRGYNIFVTGLSGTGRMTAIRKVLTSYVPRQQSLEDIVYVFNFTYPDYPRVLRLPKGRGRDFKESIHRLVENMKELISTKLDSDLYKKERDRLVSLVEQEENRSLSEFETRLLHEGFQLVHVHEKDTDATDIMPLHNGEPVDFDQLQELVSRGEATEEQWNQARERYYQLMDELKHLFGEMKQAREALDGELESLQIKTVRPGVEEAVTELKERYPGTAIEQYLEELQEDIISHLFLFQKEQPTDDQGNPALIRYGVNVLVDNAATETIPIIYENHPGYNNLFGTIESRFDQAGQSRSNFMMIKAGSLIRASGGFLVLNAEDLLHQEGLWEQLKRVLQTEEVEIQPSNQVFSVHNKLLKPEAVGIDTKVIVVGTENLYDYLWERDLDFHKYFKISAEFDSVMPRTRENIQRYVSFIRMISEEEGLRRFSPEGIAEVIRYGVYLAEQREKLSTRFSFIADLLREADYWAGREEREEVDRSAVQRALEERRYLAGLPEEKLFEMISDGEISVRISGTQIGVVNGLAVHDRGYYSFGSPAVVSARVAPGHEGIINIEREVGLSGEIHDKWVMMMEGYIRNKYAHTFPLSIYASICFEQSYTEIDGDSASVAEVLALLSAISAEPMRQNIAVSGSVNQLGEVQPVGGLSDKIAGFLRTCSRLGLTGEQGVIIPQSNVNNLVLSGEVRDAVREGNFHIYPIKTVDEGIELLTGKTAGTRGPRGSFPRQTFNARVEDQLREMANQVKNYSS